MGYAQNEAPRPNSHHDICHPRRAKKLNVELLIARITIMALDITRYLSQSSFGTFKPAIEVKNAFSSLAPQRQLTGNKQKSGSVTHLQYIPL
jgi:hypothetical protein